MIITIDMATLTSGDGMLVVDCDAALFRFEYCVVPAVLRVIFATTCFWSHVSCWRMGGDDDAVEGRMVPPNSVDATTGAVSDVLVWMASLMLWHVSPLFRGGCMIVDDRIVVMLYNGGKSCFIYYVSDWYGSASGEYSVPSKFRLKRMYRNVRSEYVRSRDHHPPRFKRSKVQIIGERRASFKFLHPFYSFQSTYRLTHHLSVPLLVSTLSIIEYFEN